MHAAADSGQLVHINVALVVFAAAHMALSAALVGPGGALGTAPHSFTAAMCAADISSYQYIHRISYQNGYCNRSTSIHMRMGRLKTLFHVSLQNHHESSKCQERLLLCLADCHVAVV